MFSERLFVTVLAFLLPLCTPTEIEGPSTIEYFCDDSECSAPLYVGTVIRNIDELSLTQGSKVDVYGRSIVGNKYLVKVGDKFYNVHNNLIYVRDLIEPRARETVKMPDLVDDRGNSQADIQLAVSTKSEPVVQVKNDLSTANTKFPVNENNERQLESDEQTSPDPHLPVPPPATVERVVTESVKENQTTTVEPTASVVPQMAHMNPQNSPQIMSANRFSSGQATASVTLKESSKSKSPDHFVNPTQILNNVSVPSNASVTQESTISDSSVSLAGVSEHRLNSPSVDKKPQSLDQEAPSVPAKRLQPSLKSEPSTSDIGTSEQPTSHEPVDQRASNLPDHKSEAPTTELKRKQQDSLSTLSPQDASQRQPANLTAQSNSGPLIQSDSGVSEQPEHPSSLFPGGHIKSSQETGTTESEAFAHSPQQQTRPRDPEIADLPTQISPSPSSPKPNEPSTPTRSPVSLTDSSSEHISNFDDNSKSESVFESPGHELSPAVLEQEKSHAGQQLPPPKDIINESAFFHCLSHASGGVLPVSNERLVSEKSSLAGLILFFGQHYFNLAQALLTQLPIAFVSSLDTFLTITFQMPLAFLTAWVLCVFSVLSACILAKLLNRCVNGTTKNPSNCVASRSLPDWMAIEENANLLASSLAEKEEAYARLIVWSTKVNERYENQTRSYSNSTTRIQTQLREAKAALAESHRENLELKDTHDELVQQLAKIKQEASASTAQLSKEIASLASQLETRAHQYEESISEKEKSTSEVVSAMRKEKEALLEQTRSYQLQLADVEKAMIKLTESNSRFEAELASRDRELGGLREVFIRLKSAELKRRKKNDEGRVKTAGRVSREDNSPTTDGWEVEDEVDFDEIAGSTEETENRSDEEEELQSSLKDFFDAGRLRAALNESEKKLRMESTRCEREAELRVQLQSELARFKCENADLLQKLEALTEDYNTSKKKLEIILEHEGLLQKNLDRHALSESETKEVLTYLRSKQRAHDLEVELLREQLTSARRELSGSESANRRQIRELENRVHEYRHSARALEKLVEDLRDENATLRQKMFTGDRDALNRLISRSLGIPPPPPPPPPPPATLTTAKSPVVRSLSRQSDTVVGKHPPVPPFLAFSPIPRGGGLASQFVPPLPPPPPPPPPPGTHPRPQPVGPPDRTKQAHSRDSA